MIPQELLLTDFLPMSFQASEEEWLPLAKIKGFRHYPSVDEKGSWTGLLGYSEGQAPVLMSHGHFLDALRLFGTFDVDILPVLNSEGTLLGCLSLTDCARFLGHTSGIAQPGSWVVFQVSARQFRLSEVTRWAESTGSKVLTAFTEVVPSEEPRVQVTFRVEAVDPADILEALARYGALSLYSSPPSVQHQESHDNLEHLLRYMRF